MFGVFLAKSAEVTRLQQFSRAQPALWLCSKKGALRIFSLLMFVIFRFLRFSNSLLMFVDISTVCAFWAIPNGSYIIGNTTLYIYIGMDQYLWIPFLGDWTSIYQLFWCSPGVQGFDTLPYIYKYVAKLHSWNSMTCANFVLSLPRSWGLRVFYL